MKSPLLGQLKTKKAHKFVWSLCFFSFFFLVTSFASFVFCFLGQYCFFSLIGRFLQKKKTLAPHSFSFLSWGHRHCRRLCLSPPHPNGLFASFHSTFPGVDSPCCSSGAAGSCFSNGALELHSGRAKELELVSVMGVGGAAALPSHHRCAHGSGLCFLFPFLFAFFCAFLFSPIFLLFRFSLLCFLLFSWVLLFSCFPVFPRFFPVFPCFVCSVSRAGVAAIVLVSSPCLSLAYQVAHVEWVIWGWVQDATGLGAFCGCCFVGRCPPPSAACCFVSLANPRF